MKCGKCGNVIKNDKSKFCSKCGAKLTKEQPVDLTEEKNKIDELVSLEVVEETAKSASELENTDEGEASSETRENFDASEKLSKIDDLPTETNEKDSQKIEESLVFEFNTMVEEEDEEENPLANGLPEWNIIPPNTTVRRRRSL